MYQMKYVNHRMMPLLNMYDIACYCLKNTHITNHVMYPPMHVSG